jgi:uncharacterized DUF497 family protein
MTTVSNGEVEWEEAKATTNLSKHGVSFEEAATVFADPSAIVLDDGSRSVLSARRASRTERLLHAEG